MTEEIDIETLTALIRKEVRTAFREAGEMLLKAILSGVREDIPPHEKRVITVVQREPIQYKNALRDDGGDLRGTELSLNKSYVSMMNKPAILYFPSRYRRC